ncbi:MAG: hypothetical protein IJD10_00575, partial [Clostridia bacterium]|nr:hypothetical protein [Clostridia bacterium]
YADYYGYTFEEFLKSAYELTPEEFEVKKQEYAESSIKSDMALYAIAAAEGITVSDEEYAAGLKRYFELTGAELGLSDEAALEQYYGKEMIRQSVLWDEVSAFLLAEGKGVEGPAQTKGETEAAA